MKEQEKVDAKELLVLTQKYIHNRMSEFVFDYNMEDTRETITNIVENLLADADVPGNFEVVCDETNNPPSIIDSNMLCVDVSIRPHVIATCIYPDGFVVTESKYISAYDDAMKVVGRTK